MRAEVIVEGIVQGIGYRFFVAEQARRHNIQGYVRNRSDGSVEVVAEGDKGLIHDFVRQLKIGPIGAHVTGINVTWYEDTHDYTDFNIRF